MNDPVETKLWDISHWPKYWAVNLTSQPFSMFPSLLTLADPGFVIAWVPVALFTQSLRSSFLGQTAPSRFRAPSSLPPAVTSSEGIFCSSLATTKISYLGSVSKSTLENSSVARTLVGGWKQPSFLLNALSQHKNVQSWTQYIMKFIREQRWMASAGYPALRKLVRQGGSHLKAVGLPCIKPVPLFLVPHESGYHWA